MRLKSLTCALLLCTALSLPAAAQNVHDARDAYNAGDYVTALAIAAPFAEAGNPIAQNLMGIIYEEGLGGVEIDIPRAIAFYEASAAGGWPPAQNNLGNILTDGIPGVPADPARAVVLFTAAHEQGYVRATINLAHLYWNGEGVGADLFEARRLLEIGAEAENSLAMNDLAVLLEDGEGGPQDLDRAMVLYRGAAELGFGLAGANVANLLMLNDAVTPEQRIEAVAWCLWSDVRTMENQRHARGAAESCDPILADNLGETRIAGQVMADTLLEQY